MSQEPYNFNTRAAGLVEEFALIPVDRVLLHWADQIVTMTEEQAEEIKRRLEEEDLNTPVIILNIEDSFAYRDPELVQAIKASYDAAKDSKE